LFSICKELKGDSKIENIDKVITLSKKNVTQTIYTLIKTNDGCIPLIELIPIFNNIGASALGSGKHESMISTVCIRFSDIAVKLVLD
jgi:hypothetical protein